MSEYQCTCKGWGYGSYHSPENKHCPLYDTYKDPAATRLDQGANSPMSREQERSSELWRVADLDAEGSKVALVRKDNFYAAYNRWDWEYEMHPLEAAAKQLNWLETEVEQLRAKVGRYRAALEFIANSLTIWDRRKGYINAIRNAAIDALTEFVAETEDAADG